MSGFNRHGIDVPTKNPQTESENIYTGGLYLMSKQHFIQTELLEYKISMFNISIDLV